MSSTMSPPETYAVPQAMIRFNENKEEIAQTKTEKLINSNPLSNRFIDISEVNFCLNLFCTTNQIASNKKPPIKEIKNSVIR